MGVCNKPLEETFKELTENGFLVYGVYVIAVLIIREKWLVAVQVAVREVEDRRNEET